jgi:Methyltransferase domain
LRNLNRTLRKAGKRIVRMVPAVDRAFSERDRLERENLELRRLVGDRERAFANHSLAPLFVEPGHFYSPIVATSDIKSRENRIFAAANLRELPGIDLRENEQLALLDKLKAYYDEMSFPEARSPSRRYFFQNPAYSYSDAIFLHCMIRHVRPKRIVEVGSGYSSCMTLDTNELFFADKIELTFIEPYPQLLLSLLRRGDRERVRIIGNRLQEVPLELFTDLEAGDILFIDSTHVVKTGSDVNQLILEVLPRVKPGVYVHLHDIFRGFEYPREWIYEGRGWSEAYLLRAFLAFNDRYRVVAFNTYLEHFHEDWFARHMPLCMKNLGGSIWLQRTS